jgi:hypothetical protein
MTNIPGALYRSRLKTTPVLVDVLEYGTHRISTQIENRSLDLFAVVMVEDGSGTLRTRLAGEQIVVAPAISGCGRRSPIPMGLILALPGTNNGHCSKAASPPKR